MWKLPGSSSMDKISLIRRGGGTKDSLAIATVTLLASSTDIFFSAHASNAQITLININDLRSIFELVVHREKDFLK